jgi:hypothetical protein
LLHFVRNDILGQTLSWNDEQSVLLQQINGLFNAPAVKPEIMKPSATVPDNKPMLIQNSNAGWN